MSIHSEDIGVFACGYELSENGYIKQPAAVRKAFTLVELLIVIAIITIMAALLLPVLESSLESARKIACAGNLKQVGLGNANYRSENGDWLPTYQEDMLCRPFLYQLNGQNIPSYYSSLWPDAIRWCPTIQTNDVYETNGTSFISPRLIYNSQMQWGYRQPQLSRVMVGARWEGRTYGGYTRTVNASYSDYVRIQPGQLAMSWQSLITTYYGKSWDPYDAAPMACCPIWEHNVSGTAIGYLIAHSGGGAKKTSWTEPSGANSLWDDGHVEWHIWPGRAITSSYLAVVTGYLNAPTPWFVQETNIYGYFTAKRTVR
jgi:prepilin-type N-terminal cleavage/methylation domain-containing protein